jgi:hypothetical protein
MDPGVLRFIAEAYLLLHSEPRDGSAVSSDKKPKNKGRSPDRGRPAKNRKVNSDKNPRETEPEL